MEFQPIKTKRDYCCALPSLLHAKFDRLDRGRRIERPMTVLEGIPERRNNAKTVLGDRGRPNSVECFIDVYVPMTYILFHGSASVTYHGRNSGISKAGHWTAIPS